MINFTFEKEHDTINEETLMVMADEMASAATSFNHHGYENFIISRDKFRTALHKFVIQNL